MNCFLSPLAFISKFPRHFCIVFHCFAPPIAPIVFTWSPIIVVVAAIQCTHYIFPQLLPPLSLVSSSSLPYAYKRPYSPIKSPPLIATSVAATSFTSLPIHSLPLSLPARSNHFLCAFTDISLLPLLVSLPRLPQWLGQQNPSDLLHCDRPCHVTVTRCARADFGCLFVVHCRV